MREIKFRAWDKNNNTWLKAQQIDDRLTFNQIAFPKVDGCFWIEDEGSNSIGIDIELMQYTGLKDKNGKEIYEGDIIQVGAGVLFSAKLTVEFIKYSWCLTAEDYIDTFNNTKPEHIKVIGNIYEHNLDGTQKA